MRTGNEIVAKSIAELKKEVRYLLSANRPKKIIFDHVPKCGGTTLNNFIAAHYPRRKTYITSVNMSSVDKFKKLPEPKRYGYDFVSGHLAYELFDFVHPDTLTITVLREPVDRIVSHYYYAKRKPQHFLYSKIVEQSLDLEGYVALEENGEMRNWYTRHFSGLTETEIDKNPAKSIDIALKNIQRRYDIIGVLDEFMSFVETLREHALLTHDYNNKKANATQGRARLDEISKKTILEIEKLNQVDIDLFNKIKRLPIKLKK